MSEDDFQGNIMEVLANVQSPNNEDGFMIPEHRRGDDVFAGFILGFFAGTIVLSILARAFY